MLRAIRADAGRQAIFSPSIATRMMDFFNNMHPTKAPQVFPELTDREREVLSLIAHVLKHAPPGLRVRRALSTQNEGDAV